MVEAASATFTQHTQTHIRSINVLSLVLLPLQLLFLLFCSLVCFVRSFRFYLRTLITTRKIWVLLHVDIVIVALLFPLHMFHARSKRDSLFFSFHFSCHAIVYMDRFPFDSIKAKLYSESQLCLLCSIFAYVT